MSRTPLIMNQPSPGIVLDTVEKRYPGGVSALGPLSLRIEPGERLVVLGPSGSGKSTLLRLIAGLEPLTGGRVFIDGEDQAEVPPHRREISMVFQDAVLFPHLNVFENLAFGLRARRPGSEISARVKDTAAMLGLSKLLGRRPDQISGGERQRVAIGRAIAWGPRLLLLDEPFASLDTPLRFGLRDELIGLHRRQGMTLIHVTHDQGEALSLSDRIAYLNQGQLIQCDAPRSLYDRPAHRKVAEFVGNPPMNLIPCEIVREPESVVVRPANDPSAVLGVDDGPASRRIFSFLPIGQSQRFDMGIRPECVRVHDPNSSTEHAGALSIALVKRVEYQGNENWIHLDLGGRSIRARDTQRKPLLEGTTVRVAFELSQASWFDPETGRGVEPGRADEPSLPEARKDDSLGGSTRDR